jgi:predicted transcriptional regulator
MTPKKINKASKLLKACSVPQRIKLITSLFYVGQTSFADIAKLLGSHKSNVARHLRDLKTIGIVEQPKKAVYRLSYTGKRIKDMLTEMET